MMIGNMEVAHHKGVFVEWMRWIGKVVADEFINGGHLLGLNCGFIALAVMVIFDFAIRWEIFLLAYLLTQTVYGFDHYHDLQNDSANDTTRVKYLQRTKKIYPYRLAIFTASFLLLLVFFGNLLAIIMGVNIFVLGISYSLGFKKLTKNIVSFKNIYVASTVSLGIVFTTLFYHTSIPVEIIFFIGYVGTSYFINCSYCDIKDMESDKKQGLRTLPLVLGKQRFFLFLIIMNSLSLSMLGILVYFHVVPFYFISLVGFNILWFLVINKGMKPDIDYHRFSTKIIDSMDIYSFLFLFIGKTMMTILVI